MGSAIQLSVAVAFPVLAGNVFAVQDTVTFAGQVMVGATPSIKKIFWRHVLLLPHSSVAVHVLIILQGGGLNWII